MFIGPLLPIALISVGVFAVSWLLIGGPVISRATAQRRLQQGLGGAEATAAGSAGASRNGRVVGMAVDLYPQAAKGYMEKLLLQAGRPAAWPVERVIAAKMVLLVVSGVLGLLLALRVESALAWVLGAFMAALGFFLPDLRLWSVGIERREAIGLQLPDTLDQMSIAVQAGLGFDAAMIRVARNGKGELAGELVRAMQDIQVGRQRREAYLDLAERCGVPALRRFMRAIVQAETYGLALSEVLHTQADEMRITRRQNAEHKAMQIPVKVIFPLIVCIMPALFIVLVGPAGIRIAEALTTMGG